MKVMVSDCLLGTNCKYNGGNNRSDALLAFLQGKEIIPVCPELLGGLTTPRLPGEIRNGVVMNANGQSVDREYRAGAQATLEIALREKPDLVILQSRSPSCGVHMIYDGTFTGVRIPGHGVTAALLLESGFRVMDIEDLDQLAD